MRIQMRGVEPILRLYLYFWREHDTFQLGSSCSQIKSTALVPNSATHSMLFLWGQWWSHLYFHLSDYQGEEAKVLKGSRAIWLEAILDLEDLNFLLCLNAFFDLIWGYGGFLGAPTYKILMLGQHPILLYTFYVIA